MRVQSPDDGTYWLNISMGSWNGHSLYRQKKKETTSNVEICGISSMLISFEKTSTSISGLGKRE